jgi:hypothetical protein
LVVGDRVRLVQPFKDLPLYSEGVVTGFYRYPDALLVSVSFGGRTESVPEDSLSLVVASRQGD